ncbi:MAG: hypothetical protein ABSB74_04920 [Tepidisphaeraceae bacterium]
MPPGPSQRSRRILVLLLLAAGVVYWLGIFGWKSLDILHEAEAKVRILAIAVALAAAFFPSLGLRAIGFIEWVNAALAPRRLRTTVFIVILVAIYILLYDWAVRELLFIKFNDEHAYMIQARMLARGRLWMPPYPPDLAPFFDALALIGDRVYAAMYFPGTAVAMLPFVWLHLPFWLMPLLAASVAAGLLYLLIAGLFDPFRGLLAVLLLLSLSNFRDVAGYLLSEMPFLATELVLLLAWIRFRRQLESRWALLVGIATGYAAITRPLDAVCLAVPVGLAIVWQLRREPRPLLRASSMIILAALPFLLLLLIQNKGVTGHWGNLPETYYNQRNFPASPMGFHHVTPEQIPQNLSPLKRQWLDWVLPMYQRHTPMNALRSWYRGRLRVTLENSLPDPILSILLPVALLCLGDIRRLVLAAILALFLVGYTFYLFFLEHYIVAILPSMICLILMSSAAIQKSWPRADRLNAFVLLCIVAISLPMVWPLQPAPPVVPSNAADQRPANALLAHLPMTPAVVLFRFDPAVASAHDDPVYNDTVAWPDDAPVIRARDLGPERDRVIYRYYAQRQPDRVFYIYDPRARADGKNPLSPPLGTARQLAENLP